MVSNNARSSQRLIREYQDADHIADYTMLL